MTGPRAALVLVSHSAALAAGAAELAAQMAPDVTVLGAGGDDTGGLGTSFAKISDALAQADSPAGTVVLYDLGSALLTTDTALEFLDQDAAARVTVVDAPLVEGALAAAVTAQAGAPRAEVAAAARAAGGSPAGSTPADASTAAPGGADASRADASRADASPRDAAPAASLTGGPPPAGARRTVPVRNRLGLHARPVAELIRAVAGLNAEVQIGRPGGPLTGLGSLLGVVSLALRGGDEAEIAASGPDAQAAAGRVADLIEAGFGELGEPATATPAATAPSTTAGSAPETPAPAASPGPATGPPHSGPTRPGSSPAPDEARSAAERPGGGSIPAPGTSPTHSAPTRPGSSPAPDEARSAAERPGGERAAEHGAAPTTTHPTHLGSSPAPDGAAAGPVGEWAAQPGSPGRAIGPAVRLASVEVPDRAGTGTEAESERLAAAVDQAAGTLAAAGDPLSQAHSALLRDPLLATAAQGGLDRGLAAESAWWQGVQQVAGQLAASADELIAARAADVREAGTAVLAALGVAADRVPPAVVMNGAVLLADELGPGEVVRIAERGGAAAVLSGGSPTAHAVLVARNLGLPLVLGAGLRTATIPPGTVLDVNGTTGQLTADPPDLDRRRADLADARAEQDRLRAAAAGPVTVGGRRILVEANIGSLAEARAAVAAGADGVGLLRTELLLLDQRALPDEEAQRAQLSEIFAVLGDRPVVVRVLDAGGDKPVRALRLDPVRNGFLGVRGWRWLAAHPDVLRTQLRAIGRAAAGGHRVDVMAPMITVAAEAAAFRAAAVAAAGSLAADGLEHAPPRLVGVMIEVPAAAVAADEIAAEADFLSVGTNDLVAYTMAADRTEPGVAGLADPRATAVWRLLEQICAGAARYGRPVAVCGEMAADERFAARLAGLGVTGLSMAAGRIPAVKALLRQG